MESPTKKRLSWWKWTLLLLGALILGLIADILSMAGTDIALFVFNFPALTIVTSALTVGFYAVCVRLIEKHWPTDLDLLRLVPHTLLGLVVGLVFMVVVVGTIVAMGDASVEGNEFSERGQFIAIMMFLAVAVGEEIMCRGFIFRIIDERWNTWAALIVSSLIFGFGHIANDNATWWSSLAIAIEAGLLLGTAYKWSGTLWLPIGIHWAWNYVQGNVFGIAVSGASAGNSILVTNVEGPDIITGGAFGVEASIISVILGTLLTVVFLWNRYRSPKL